MKWIHSEYFRIWNEWNEMKWMKWRKFAHRQRTERMKWWRHLLLLILLLARSPDDPQRIRVASVFEFRLCSLFVCLFSVGKFSPFHSFHFISFISISKIFAVLAFHSFQFLKYSLYWHRTHKTSVRVKKTIRQSMPCTVAHSTRRYIGTALGPLHPGLHQNGA